MRVIADIALQFGTFEYFSIALFSLTMIASLSSGSVVKGLLAALLGLMCATIGLAPVDAALRFTFGNNQLLAGVDILPVLIGMFALSEIMVFAENRGQEESTISIDVKNKMRGFGFTVAEFMGQMINFLRSALIGMGIGILPGLGGSTANLIAYSVAQNQSRYPKKFGTGIIDGLVATETANNASIGGAMVPLLTLGIPGDMANLPGRRRLLPCARRAERRADPAGVGLRRGARAGPAAACAPWQSRFLRTRRFPVERAAAH